MPHEKQTKTNMNASQHALTLVRVLDMLQRLPFDKSVSKYEITMVHVTSPNSDSVTIQHGHRLRTMPTRHPLS